MSAQPDIAGFNEAMARLHALFDTSVTFHVPPDPETTVWPDGTPFDDETGMPLDPLVDPTSGGDVVDVIVKAGVIHRPGVSGDETAFTAAGLFESVTMVLSLPPDVYDLVKEATAVTVYGEMQKITERRPDGAFGGVDRWLVYVEGM